MKNHIKKTVIALFWILVCSGFHYAARVISMNLTAGGSTIVITEDTRDPYTFSERVRKLQNKLNRALSFNLTNYTLISESGFWDDATEKALETFREMVYKKYNLQRYYAFSASANLSYSSLEGLLDAEVPDPAKFLAQADEKIRMRVQDPANVFGTAAQLEIARIEKGLFGDYVDPVTGELSRTVPIYESPFENPWLIPIRFSARYSSQMTGDGGIGKGWYLSEQSSLWFSFEKKEVIVQDPNGVSQKYHYSNEMMEADAERTDGNYFQHVELHGLMGIKGSTIEVKTGSGEVLVFTAIEDSGGDSIQDVISFYDSLSGQLLGYTLKRDARNTVVTNLDDTNFTLTNVMVFDALGGSNETVLTNFALKITSVKREEEIKRGIYAELSNLVDLTSAEDAAVNRDSYISHSADMRSYLESLKNNSENGWNLTFYYEHQDGRNVVYSFRKSPASDPQVMAGYVLTSVSNRFGAYKTYSYDSYRKLSGVKSYGPAGTLYDQAVLFYRDDATERTDGLLTVSEQKDTETSKPVSLIQVKRGSLALQASFGYTSNNELSRILLSSQGTNLADYGFSYQSVALPDGTQASATYTGLIDAKADLQVAILDISNAALNIQENKYDWAGTPQDIRSLVPDHVARFFGSSGATVNKSVECELSYYESLERRMWATLEQVKKQYQGVLRQIADFEAGKFRTYLPLLAVSTEDGDETRRYEFTIKMPVTYQQTNIESGIRVKSVVTPYGTAEFGFTLGQTTFKSPSSGLYTFYYNANETNYSRRRVHRVLYPNGSSVGLVYTPEKGLVTAITNEMGRVFHYTYDDFGNTLSKSLPGGREWRYTYAHPLAKYLGRPTLIEQPDGTKVVSAYNDLGELSRLDRVDGEGISNMAQSISLLTQGGDVANGYFRREEQNREGETVVSTLDRDGNLLCVEFPDGGRATYVRDAWGRATSENRGALNSRGMSGVTYYRQYDALGREIKRGISHGPSLEVKFNPRNQRVSETDGLGRTSRFEYDRAGRLTKVVMPDGSRIEKRYNFDGELVEEFQSGRGSKYFSYNLLGLTTRQVLSNETAVYVYNYSYDLAGSLTGQQSLADGKSNTLQRLSYERDEMGQLTRETDLKSGLQRELYYDAMGNVTNEVTASGGVTLARMTVYDIFCRPVAYYRSQNGGETVFQSSNHYLPMHRMAKFDAYGRSSMAYYDYRENVTNQEFTVYDPIGLTNITLTQKKIYDSLGNKIKEIWPDGSEQEWTYRWGVFPKTESIRRFPEEARRVMVYSVDNAGQVIRVTDPIRNYITYEYNLLGQKVRETDAEGRVILTEYDQAGNPVHVKLGNRETFLQYDMMNRALVEKDGTGAVIVSRGLDAAGNIVWEAPGGLESRKVLYDLDAAGRAVKKTFPNGLEMTTVYNPEGNVISETGHDTLTSRTKTTVSRYDALGRQLSENTPQGLTEYEYSVTNELLYVKKTFAGMQMVTVYDQMDRELKTMIADSLVYSKSPYSFFEGPGKINGKVYDHAGRVRLALSPGNRVAGFAYNGSGQTVAETNAAGQVTFTFYDAVCRATVKRDAYGNETRFSYDRSGKVISQTLPLGGTTSFEYGADGERTKEFLPGGGVRETVRDERGRPIMVKLPAGGVERTWYGPGGEVVKTQNALGALMEYGYTDAGVLRQTRTSGIGIATSVTEIDQSAFGETNRIVLPLGMILSNVYSNSGQVVEEIRSWNTPEGIRTVSSTNRFDSAGRLIRRSEGGGIAEVSFYSVSGFLLSNGTTTNDSPLFRVRRYEYGSADGSGLSLGETERAIEADGRIVDSFYDILGRVTNTRETADGDIRENITYYGIAVVDGKTNETMERWRQASGVETVRTKDTINALGQVWKSEYRLGGRWLTRSLSAVDQYGRTVREENGSSGGRWTEMAYDPVTGFLRQKQTEAGVRNVYTYNNAGLLIEEVRSDAGGKSKPLTTRKTYDVLGRVLCESAHNESGEMISGSSNVYDASGRLVKTENMMSGLVTEHAYDQANQDWVETRTWKNISRANTNRYDRFGRLTETWNALGGRTTREYDALGQTVSETVHLSGHSLVKRSFYDVFGREIKDETEGETKANGVWVSRVLTTTRTYDKWGNNIRETGPDGTHVRGYDIWGLETLSTNADGLWSRTEYDDAGRVSMKTVRSAACPDESVSVSYTRDDDGRVIRTVSTGGGVSEESRSLYDESGNVIRDCRLSFDGSWRVSAKEYDAFGRVVREQTAWADSPEGTLRNVASDVRFEYDAAGRTVRTTGGEGSVGESAYAYENGSKVTRSIKRNGSVSAIWTGRENGFGETVDETDPLGAKVSYEYNALGKRTAAIDPSGARGEMIYDAFGRETGRKDPLGNLESSEFDSFGNAMKVTDAAGGFVEREFDELGRPICVKDATGAVNTFRYNESRENGLKVITEVRTDALGHITKVVSRAGLAVASVDGLSRTSVRGYDALGRLVSALDPRGYGKKLALDAYGQIVSETDALDQKIQYGYDAAGRKNLTRTSASMVSRFFDLEGRLKSVSGQEGTLETFEYDGWGNLRRAKNAAADYIYAYDMAGRLTNRIDVMTGESLRYSYDARGLRIRLDAKAHNVSYAYDAAGRLIHQIVSNSGGTERLRLSYAYDGAGRLTEKHWSKGLSLYVNYDRAHRITNMRYTRSRELSRQAALAMATSDASSGATNTTSAGEETSVEEGGDSDPDADGDPELIAFHYTYDAAGNRLNETRIETLSGGKAETNISRFDYDESYRLVYADYGAGSSERFTYDASGNRLETVAFARTTDTNGQSLEVKTVSAGVFDQGNRLIALRTTVSTNSGTAAGGQKTYKYDTAGRLVQRTESGGIAAVKTERFIYNDHDQMVRYSVEAGSSYEETLYAYDPAGMRVKKTVPLPKSDSLVDQTLGTAAKGGVTRYSYDGMNILYENDAFYLGGSQINAYEAILHPMKLAMFVKDALGSIRGEQYDAGSVSRYEYTAYGSAMERSVPEKDKSGWKLGSSARVKTGIGFTGHYGDSENGLYYARARFYDPAEGRFLTPDPVDDARRYSAPGLNVYQYGMNNPMSYWDPDGRFINVLVGAIIGSVVGTVSALVSNLSDVISGKMPIWEYALNSLLGGLAGGASGAVQACGVPLTFGLSTKGASVGVGYGMGALSVSAGVNVKFGKDGIRSVGAYGSAAIGNDKFGLSVNVGADYDIKYNRTNVSAGVGVGVKLGDGFAGISANVNRSITHASGHAKDSASIGVGVAYSNGGMTVAGNVGFNFGPEGYSGMTAGAWVGQASRDKDGQYQYSVSSVTSANGGNAGLGLSFDKNGRMSGVGVYTNFSYSVNLETDETQKPQVVTYSMANSLHVGIGEDGNITTNFDSSFSMSTQVVMEEKVEDKGKPSPENQSDKKNHIATDKENSMSRYEAIEFVEREMRAEGLDGEDLSKPNILFGIKNIVGSFANLIGGLVKKEPKGPESIEQIGERYKNAMKNYVFENGYYVVTIDGVKFKFNIYNFDGPNYYSSNTNINSAIEGMNPKAVYVLITQSKTLELNEVEVSSLRRYSNTTPIGTSPHMSGRGLDITSVVKDGVKVYFNNSLPQYQSQSEQAMALRDTVYQGFVNNSMVSAALDPWYLSYNSDSSRNKDNVWETRLLTSGLSLQQYNGLTTAQRNALMSVEDQTMINHRHHLHITVYE